MNIQLPERKKDLTDENIDNVIQLKTVTGGKSPPSDFWLVNLGIGTVFLSRRKGVSIEASRDFTYGEFCVFNKTDKACLLLVHEGGPQPRPIWVDPIKFSNQMELVEVLKTDAFQTVTEEQEKKDGSD